jgi:hypothetical protein
MNVIINDPYGFVDTTELNGLCHSPSPGLEWNSPVFLNGEVVEIVATLGPSWFLVRLGALRAVVSRRQVEFAGS